MRSLLCALAILVFHIAAGEKIIQGFVLKEDRQPVAFASIGIMGTSHGTVADSSGKFVMYLPDHLQKNDSIRISCIGFRPKTFRISEVSDSLFVILKEADHLLPELVVKPALTRKKTVGNKRNDTFLACNFAISNKPGQNLGAEIGRKFFFKGKKHYINQINIYMATNFDTVLFRLNVYDIKKGLPGNNLLKENIILKTTKKFKGWTSFNLGQYHLVFDQDIIVALEWIGHSKKGKIVLMNLTFPSPGAVHFYKFGSQDKWKRYPQMSASINLDVEVEK